MGSEKKFQPCIVKRDKYPCLTSVLADILRVTCEWNSFKKLFNYAIYLCNCQA